MSASRLADLPEGKPVVVLRAGHFRGELLRIVDRKGFDPAFAR